MTPTDVAIAIIIQAGKVLLSRRSLTNAVLPGLYEFPGGKVSIGETPEACVQRECLEELGIAVKPVEALPVIEHTYPSHAVRLHPFVCHITGGTPFGREGQNIQWVEVADLPQLPLPPANQSLVELLRRRG